MVKSNPSHTVIVKMRSRGGPEYVGVDEKFMANADQALFTTSTSASPTSTQTVREPFTGAMTSS